MRKIGAIVRREARSYFVTPIPYVIIAAFLIIAGYLFTTYLFLTQSASPDGIFGNVGVVLIFAAPLLTLRSFAEEWRLKTDELLLTAPVTVGDIVLGKYLGVMLIYAALLVCTLWYPAVLAWISNPDPGPLIGGYIGLLLMGGAFLAVGVFASSLTQNQMVAGMIGFGLLLLFWIVGWASAALSGTLGEVLRHLSLLDEFTPFAQGLIDSSHVFFYLSFIAAFLFLTARVIDRRRWAG